MKKIYAILLLTAISLSSLLAYNWYVTTKCVNGNGYIETAYTDAAEIDHQIDYSIYIAIQSKPFTVTVWPPDPVPDLFWAEGLGDYDECPAGEIGSHHNLIIDSENPLPRDDDDPMEEW